MTHLPLMPVVTCVALVAVNPLFDVPILVVIGFVCAAALLALTITGRRSPDAPGPSAAGKPELGDGTVREITEVAPSEVLVTIDVESAPDDAFTGSLRHRADDPVAGALEPGMVVLVASHAHATETLSLPDDMLAVHAPFEGRLVRRDMSATDKLDLLHTGVKTRGVVTGIRATGTVRADCYELCLDVIVGRPEGGQFPATETAFVPASSVSRVSPGTIVDTYYRRGNESAVAVRVPGRRAVSERRRPRR